MSYCSQVIYPGFSFLDSQAEGIVHRRAFSQGGTQMQADAKRIILPRMVGFRKFGTLERVGCLLPLEGLWSGKGINVGSNDGLANSSRDHAGRLYGSSQSECNGHPLELQHKLRRTQS